MLFESVQRTELLFQLISIFEQQKFEKFKVYTSKNISVKQSFDVSQLNPGSYESNLTIDELTEKKA